MWFKYITHNNILLILYIYIYILCIYYYEIVFFFVLIRFLIRSDDKIVSGTGGNGTITLKKNSGKTISITGFRSTHTATYKPTTYGSSIDMGQYHNYRYLDTTGISRASMWQYTDWNMFSENDFSFTFGFFVPKGMRVLIFLQYDSDMSTTTIKPLKIYHNNKGNFEDDTGLIKTLTESISSYNADPSESDIKSWSTNSYYIVDNTSGNSNYEYGDLNGVTTYAVAMKGNIDLDHKHIAIWRKVLN